MTNPAPYDDQTYGSGRSLDHQEGRLAGHMRHQPLILRPTSIEFWALFAGAFGGAIILGGAAAIVITPPVPRLLLAVAGFGSLAFILGLASEAVHRWRKRSNRPYPGRPGAQSTPRP